MRMHALEVLSTGYLLAGIQYDRDVEEAYAEEERRNAAQVNGFWRDAGLGVEQWVEPK